MMFLFVAFSLIVSCFGSSLEILSTPSTVTFPESSSTLKTTQLSSLNEYVLGLSARPVDGFDVKVDIFSRPRALAVINVEGVDSLELGKSYEVEADGVQSAGIEQELALVFGQDRQSVQLNAAGIAGSQLALAAQQQTVDTSVIKTKLPTLRRELEGVYKLAAAIKAAGTQLDNTADVFRVSITGLVGLNDEAEKKTALADIKNAINQLNSVINTAYGNQAVVEVLATSSTIEKVDGQSIPEHKIVKRAATDSPSADPLKAVRAKYNVSVAVSQDYPAIFAIFLGLVLILTIALIYIIVGMLSMDPGKDSIIYRMTTTRVKKD